MLLSSRTTEPGIFIRLLIATRIAENMGDKISFNARHDREQGSDVKTRWSTLTAFASGSSLCLSTPAFYDKLQ